MIVKVKGFEIFRFWELNVVGSPPIMSQLTLIGIHGFHLRIHEFFRGDGDTFHDHPRHFVSVCVSGEYLEKLIDYPSRQVRVGTITLRRATDAHNVTPVKFPCVTIAVTSPIVRQWRSFKCE